MTTLERLPGLPRGLNSGLLDQGKRYPYFLPLLPGPDGDAGFVNSREGARAFCRALARTEPRFDPAPPLHRALVTGYAADLEQLALLVPGLDLSLWPTAREAGLA